MSKDPFKPIDTAPKDGAIIIARYKAWNSTAKPVQVEYQPVWWMPDSKGKNPRWKRYGTLDTTAFLDEWCTPAEFAAWAPAEHVQPPRKPEPVKETEYDL